MADFFHWTQCLQEPIQVRACVRISSLIWLNNISFVYTFICQWALEIAWVASPFDSCGQNAAVNMGIEPFDFVNALFQQILSWPTLVARKQKLSFYNVKFYIFQRWRLAFAPAIWWTVGELNCVNLLTTTITTTKKKNWHGKGVSLIWVCYRSNQVPKVAHLPSLTHHRCKWPARQCWERQMVNRFMQ